MKHNQKNFGKNAYDSLKLDTEKTWEFTYKEQHLEIKYRPKRIMD